MKIKLFTSLFLLLMTASAFAGTIILEGNYQGKNLYVKNPFAGTGVGFCAFEVRINGDLTTDEINSSAFEIDFTAFQLDIGQEVIVTIKHKDDCRPKVLNPEVLKPRSTFEIVTIDGSKSGLVNWTAKGEVGALPYIIEQYRWNKWVKVGEVDGKGLAQASKYSFQITPHSGENKVRVKQIDYTGKPRYSKPVTFMSPSASVTFSPTKVSNAIDFSDGTLFEIYDIHGNIVKKGYGEVAEVSNLKKGTYYLSFDNKTEKFQKK